MSDAVIAVEKLSKRYQIGERERNATFRDLIARKFAAPFHKNRRRSAEILWALRDVSFDLKQGEVAGLIGRNGAGKSTLLKILARITRPTMGSARVRGRIASLLEVGTGFHPELTGRENVFLNGAILGMRNREIISKFDEIVAFAEIEPFIDTPVKRYSSGMYIRLAFAVAAHLDPEILFVDEVLSVGDASFQRKCVGKMSDFARHGRTIVFVSHNMNALRKLCSRALWIDKGHVISDGPSTQVVTQYLQKNLETNLECVWDKPQTAPGDDRVRLRSVRIMPQGHSTDPITVHTALRIEFTYWNYVPEAVLNVSMIVNNVEEVCIFNSVSDISPRSTGLIRHTVTIPGDLLNAGFYYVNLIIVKDGSVGILFKNNVVSFEVLEGEIVGNWYGKIPGATRPKLHWKSESIEVSDFEATADRNL